MKNTYFLHKLTKVCSSTKITRIMLIICSQRPLENTSYIILMLFQMESRQETGKSLLAIVATTTICEFSRAAPEYSRFFGLTR